LDDHAKPAGLYMDWPTIDYFDVVAGSGPNPSLVGLSVSPASIRTRLGILITNLPTSGAQIVYLHLPSPPSLDWVPQLDYSTDCVWSVSTDEFGNTQWFTQKVTVDPDTKAQNITVWYLAHSDNNILSMINLPSPDDKDYPTLLKSTQWSITIEEEPTMIGSVASKAKAVFRAGDSVLSLRYQDGKPVSLALESAATIGSAHEWWLEMQPLHPTPFKYVQPLWQLTTDQRVSRFVQTRPFSPADQFFLQDETDTPYFDIPNSSSSNLKWTISPALDNSVFELVQGDHSGDAEGAIRLKSGVTPKIMDQTDYTVTCTLMLPSGVPAGSVSANVSIVVTAPVQPTPVP
jgi:hypothetical protein